MNTDIVISRSRSDGKGVPVDVSFCFNYATNDIFTPTSKELESVKGFPPFKRRDSCTINEHVLPTFVSKSLRLGHMKCQHVSRINSHLSMKNNNTEPTFQ